MVRTRDVVKLFLEWIYCIVHGEALAGILMVLIDNGLTGQLRHAHDAVGPVHTVLLYGIHCGIDLAAAAVEVGGMHVYAERLAADLLGMDTCRIGEPVMSMDNVKLLSTSHLSGDDRVIVDLFVKVAWITACKLHGAKVVDVHIVEVGVDMVAQLEVILGRHYIATTLFDVVVADVAPGDRHTIHGNNTTGTCVLVAEGTRKTEHSLDVALGVKPLTDTIVGSGKTAKDMRRILPTKH